MNVEPAIIDVMIVIDTISLTQNSSRQNSTNENPATCDAALAFMITDLDHAIAGNGTADLHIRVRPRDALRIASICSNPLDNQISLYDFGHRSGDNVLDLAGMKKLVVTRIAAVPTPNQAYHLPPRVTFQNANFYAQQIDVNGSGREDFYVKFVVYGLASGRTRPIHGHFQWNASITVSPGGSPARG